MESSYTMATIFWLPLLFCRCCPLLRPLCHLVLFPRLRVCSKCGKAAQRHPEGKEKRWVGYTLVDRRLRNKGDNDAGDPASFLREHHILTSSHVRAPHSDPRLCPTARGSLPFIFAPDKCEDRNRKSYPLQSQSECFRELTFVLFVGGRGTRPEEDGEGGKRARERRERRGERTGIRYMLITTKNLQSPKIPHKSRFAIQLSLEHKSCYNHVPI